MILAVCFRRSIQCPPIHLLRLAMFALISVKNAQAVDGVKWWMYDLDPLLELQNERL